MAALTVLFATHNGAHTLPRMLATLQALESPEGGWKVIAVDNGSTDETSTILKESVRRLPLTIVHEPRPGKNIALNAGLALSEGDIVALTDDDVILPRNWLVAIQSVAAQNPAYSIFGGAIFPVWEESPPDWFLQCATKGWLAWTDLPEGPCPARSVWGPNMAVRSAVFLDHKFSEGIGPNGTAKYATGSDIEFTAQAARRRHKCWHSHAAPVGHLIRPFQLTREWLLQRAYNQGRGADREKLSAGGAEPLGRHFEEATRESGDLAAVAGPEARFKATLDREYRRGYLAERAVARTAVTDAPPETPPVAVSRVISHPRVAVVTPYRQTPDAWLRFCHESVRAQSYPCTHVLVADGEPQAAVREFHAYHIVLGVTYADFGDTPRAIGSKFAIEQGFDAIAYLDSDNWYNPNHVASLVTLHRRTGAAVCTSKRTIHHLDGRLMALCLTSDGERFCDTNCLMLMRPAFIAASIWGRIADDEHPIDDRVVWSWILDSDLSRAHSDLATVGYRATHRGLYSMMGWPIPDDAKNTSALAEANAKWLATGNPSLSWDAFFDAAALRNRGRALLKAKRFEDALASYEEVMKLQPQQAQSYYDCGMALLMLHYYEEAIERFDRALAIDADYAACHHDRGVSLGALGRHREAIESFDRALARKPGYDLALRNREAARRLLNRAAADKP